MLGSIRQMGAHYYDSLPDHIIRTIGLSAVISFTVTVLLSKKADGVMDMSRPILAAGVAATASAIHALTAPLFKDIFGSWDGYTCAELSKMVIATVLASAAIHALSNPAHISSTKFLFYSAMSLNFLRAIFDPDRAHNVDNSAYIYWA